MNSAMSSPAVYSHRASRKLEIPSNLISNWKASSLQGAKPPVRRPKTACERCRTAKARCHGDGTHDCSRCTSRGFPCRYTQTSPYPDDASAQCRSDRERTARDEVQMGVSVDDVNHFGGDDAAYQQLVGFSIDWPGMNSVVPLGSPHQTQQQQHLDWASMDPEHPWTSSRSMDFSGALQVVSTGPSQTSSVTNTSNTPASEERPSLESLGLFPLLESTTAADLSWQSQLTSQPCQCRDGLALLIPSARTALQERRLDTVCQVTNDVIRRCQNIVGCASCSVNCTDLICIMAVFQEVDICFEYIAHGDIDKLISVSMGSYAMEIEDEHDARRWRQMLVAQLVRRANGLLDSISASGQGMLRELDPGCKLGRVNIDYLEAVIGNSRDNFHRIMNGFGDEKGITV